MKSRAHELGDVPQSESSAGSEGQKVLAGVGVGVPVGWAVKAELLGQKGITWRGVGGVTTAQGCWSLEESGGESMEGFGPSGRS